MLPPGQKVRKDFPRFGLPPYAHRFPHKTTDLRIAVAVNGSELFTVDIALSDLPRYEIETDFHCVTTWSFLGANWGGVKFVDFYEKYIRHPHGESSSIAGAILYAQDGYKTTLILEDLLRDTVLLVDSLDGKSLSVEHGSPLRLVAPEHYGYKNLKHLSKIEFYTTLPIVKRGIRAFLDHPRARVDKEERSRWIPGWILRFVYRNFISSTARNFRLAMQRYKDGGV